jgi:hypothetical protein
VCAISGMARALRCCCALDYWRDVPPLYGRIGRDAIIIDTRRTCHFVVSRFEPCVFSVCGSRSDG